MGELLDSLLVVASLIDTPNDSTKSEIVKEGVSRITELEADKERLEQKVARVQEVCDRSNGLIGKAELKAALEGGDDGLPRV